MMKLDLILITCNNNNRKNNKLFLACTKVMNIFEFNKSSIKHICTAEI